MKAILAILTLIGMTGTSLGQGTVNWQVISFVAVTAQTNTQQYSPIFGGGPTGGGAIGNTAPASSGLVYYYELLYNANFTGSQVPAPNTAAALLGSWLDTGLTATNNNALGGGRIMPVNPNPAAVAPWNNGVTNNIMLVGWSANLGTSWATVSNKLANWDYYSSSITGEAFFGVSATGYLTPQASGTAPGAAVFATDPTTNGLPIYSPNMQLYCLSPQESGWGGGPTNYPDAALRAALELTNKVVFTFDGTIVLTNTIFIHTNIVLDATGHRVTISGNHTNRVFYVGSGGDLTLSNLVIANGRSDQGAGVCNAGSVTAVNCTFTGNSVVGGAGSDNQNQGAGGAGGSVAGGAVWNAGLLRFSGCTVVGNSAVGGPGGQGGWGNMYPPMSPGAPGGAGGDAAGGALFNGGTARLVNCTLAINTGQGGVGGPGGYGYVVSPDYPPGPRGPNGASGLSVGGIYDASGQCYVTNCTVVFNTGTGIWTAGSNGAKLINTLLAENSPGGNGAGAITDFGHNLSSDATCAFTNTGSMNNTYPLLGLLADNGGPTLTVALLPGCRAIDAGDTATAPPTDQRGVARPFGMAADIGAYEFNGTTSSVPPTVVTECTEAALRAAMSSGGHVTFACDGTIPLASTIVVITNTFLDATGHHITVQGIGTNLFLVNPGVTFSLANLALTGGSAVEGAGIDNTGGFVNVTSCVFSGNIATRGGAICNSGTLVVDLCVFNANSAVGAGGLSGNSYGAPGGSGDDAPGGAICNFGTVTISRSTFNNNLVAAGAGAGGYMGYHGDPGMSGGGGGNGGAGGNGKGGALYNAGTARVSSSTFAYNSGTGGNGGAGADGGPNYGGPGSGGNGGSGGAGGTGVGALFNLGNVEIINSTFAYNSGLAGSGGTGGNGAEGNIGGSGGAGGNGGSGTGALYGLPSSCQITNCTFAGNSGESGNGGSGGTPGKTDYPYGNYGGSYGAPGSGGSGTGGIWANGGILINTVLAANAPNGSGTITDAGHNLSSDGSCAFTAAGSMNNTDPKLGSLTDNGGPTLTMALLPGSPAIDAGTALGAPATDQRGVPRPQGAGVDIGAFEYLVSPVFTGMTVQNATNCQMQLCGLTPNPALTLQVSTNLLNWRDVTNFMAGPNGVFQCVDPIPGDTQARFYRLKSGTP
jgi:hypothetical protein